MLSITKIFSFEAAHFLPKHEGLCHNLHGHGYKLEITIAGDIESNKTRPDYGMIIDFGQLKEVVNAKVIDKYDHSCLNDFFKNPTAENMVAKIVKKIAKTIEPDCGIFLQSVKLWETTTSYAEWRNEL